MTTPTGILFSDPQAKPLSTVGQPQAAAYYLFYLTGGTTPAPVYADGLLTTALSQTPGAAQPSCTADSAGRFNPIYMNPSLVYRVQLYNSLGVKLEDTDPYVVPGIGNAAAIGAALYPESTAETAASVTIVNGQIAWGNVLRYGSNTTPGSTDMTTAIQAALSQSQQATGAPAYCPPQTYLISSSLTASAAFSLNGSSRYNTIITWSSKTLTALEIAADASFVIQGLQFEAPASCTAGGAISITGSSTANNFSQIRDCQFSNGWTQVDTISCAQFYIADNYFTGYVYAGIIVQNQWNGDDGDSTLMGNIFSNGGSSAVAIAHASSGGLRVINNKVNGGAYGYLLNLASGVSTSVLIIVGNSFENQTTANLGFNSAGGGAVYESLQIVGNELALCPTNIEFVYGGACFSDVVISGNTIACGNGSSALNAIVVEYVSNMSISGNAFSVESGTPACIVIDGHSSGTIGVNAFSAGFSANITNASVGSFNQAMLPVTPSTGWGTPTAGSVTNNFPGTGATLAECGGALSTLILKLQAAGLCGT
ncbi:MAG: glycosyl hydrolase family 28-related protein [Steroidobacteraceae bacterium]